MISVTRDIGLVSFTGNPIMLGVKSYNHVDGSNVPRPFYTIFCQIFLADPALNGDPYDTLSIVPDANGDGQFDLSTVLKGLCKPILPWPITAETQAVLDTNARVQFWYRLADGYGVPFAVQTPQSPSNACYAIPGGLSDEILEQIDDADSNAYAFLVANQIAFTSQPARKRTTANQPEIFRFFNPSPQTIEVAQLTVKQTDFDGDTHESIIWSGMLAPLMPYTFNVTPGVSFALVQDCARWEVFIRGGDIESLVTAHDVPFSQGSTTPDWTLTITGAVTRSNFPLTNPYYFGANNETQPASLRMVFAVDGTKHYKVTFERKYSGDYGVMFNVGDLDTEIEALPDWALAEVYTSGTKMNDFGIYITIPAGVGFFMRNLKIEEVVYEDLSETLSYALTEDHPTNPRCFIFQNSLGGFDTLLSVGKRTITSEGEASSGYIAKSSTVRNWLEPLQERRASKNVYRGALGYFTNAELNWLREMFLSEEKYLVNGSRLEHVTLRQNEFPSDTDEPPGQIEIEAVIGSPLSFFF